MSNNNEISNIDYSGRKVWPIKTASACQYKWAWTTIYLNLGISNSCHRVFGGRLDTIDFKDFHNHPEKIKDRELMLKGEWPDNDCHYCKRIEDAGGKSERIGYINEQEFSPAELDNNPTATHVSPRILEIYFNNLCNQSCVYCSPMFSSVIEQELKKFGSLSKRYNLDGEWKLNRNYDKFKAEFWNWMHEHSTTLYDFQVLGGEPLFQPDFEECLSFFETHNNPNLNWRTFSNLKHNTDQFKIKIDRIVELLRSKKIGRLEIIVSIDCWGAEQEYARNGMSLDNWQDNFNVLLNTPEINILIQSTLSSITLPTAWELVDKINSEWSKVKFVNQGWNTIANPPFLDPSIFGHYMKGYTDKLLKSVEDYRLDFTYLRGMCNQIVSAPVNKPMLLELRNYLDELDIRRDQNWRSIYPWMDEIFKKEL